MTRVNKKGFFHSDSKVLLVSELLIYMLTAIGLSPGGSNIIHIYTQKIHRAIQLTTIVGRLSGIRTQSGQTKTNDELTA
jgi:uncharacterized integral membrane protein